MLHWLFFFARFRHFDLHSTLLEQEEIDSVPRKRKEQRKGHDFTLSSRPEVPAAASSEAGGAPPPITRLPLPAPWWVDLEFLFVCESVCSGLLFAHERQERGGRKRLRGGEKQKELLSVQLSRLRIENVVDHRDHRRRRRQRLTAAAILLSFLLPASSRALPAPLLAEESRPPPSCPCPPPF